MNGAGVFDWNQEFICRARATEIFRDLRRASLI